MEERQAIFNNYIEEFKKLDINEKREELIKSLKVLIAVFDQMAKDDNIEIKYMSSKEILDLNKENVSESDFIESAFVYLEVAKDIIGQYLLNVEKKGN